MTTKKLKQDHCLNGFTMTELVVVMFSAAIVTLSLGVFLGNVQGNWNSLFTRVYSDPVVDGFAVHKVFDGICRKASLRKYMIGNDGEWLQLYYWDSGSTAAMPENYALFYQWGDVLCVKYGQLQTGTWQPDYSKWTEPMNLANDVESVKFEVSGASVQMYLTYNDGETMPVVCSSVRHNE